MAEKIISNDEIKLITGITGADGKIEIFNKAMTSLLASKLGLKQFSRFVVQSEAVDVIDDSHFRVRSFPVLADSVSLYRDMYRKVLIENYTYQLDDYDSRKFTFLNESGNQAYLPLREYFASYTAGFILNATIEVTDNDLSAITLSVTNLGVTTVYTFIASGTPEDDEILIGEDADATMTNIATELGGIGVDGVVQLPLGMTVATSEVSEDPKIVFENPDEMLDELKIAVAYMVAGAISDKSQIEGVTSYRMGTKQVNFRDMSEKNFVDDIMKRYLGKYKRALILSN